MINICMRINKEGYNGKREETHRICKGEKKKGNDEEKSEGNV